MSQENKIDFTTCPQGAFFNLYGDDENRHQSGDIFFALSDYDVVDYDRIVLFIVIIAYMRINSTKADIKFHIPQNASLETLACNKGENFFKELFNRFKIICEANEVLGETAVILESSYMSGADKASRSEAAGIEIEIPELDWSDRGFDSGFGKRDCSLYVKDGLIWTNSDEYGFKVYRELHHLAPLLKIQSKEKQLCTPILYITYLANLFEQLGWDKNGCENIANTYLDKVTAIQVDPELWAIQTLQIALFGCDKKLISKGDELSEIHTRIQNNAKDSFDVIFLPELRDNSFHGFSIPDVGHISIGDIIIEKKSCFYYVAFLYNLLNDKGRMLVRLNNNSLKKVTALVNDGRLLAFFVDNNLIETMIQTEDSVYMLIDKNRPATKHGKIFFYYLQDFLSTYPCYPAKNEELALSIDEYSCEYIKLRHDEGACIVSNQEIRLNNYCLLPKKYIYDFDRITANAEFQVVRHLAHDLSPKLSIVDSVLKHLTRFVASHDLLLEPLQEQFYEVQTLELVGEAIDKARSDISQMHKLIKDTRKVITEKIPIEEFSSVNLRDFLETAKKKYANGTITLDIDCDQDIQYEMHETSFAEMIDNFVRNAEVHGFVNGCNRTESKIAIVVTKRNNDPNLIVEIRNNGNPLPDELTVDKFISFGSKGKSSSGDGLGGAFIYKVIRAHRGSLEIIRDDKEYPVNFKITLPHTGGVNEQD
jgi:hypothetical protein